MVHDPEIERAIRRFRLGMPQLSTPGRSGELLGRGAGSSLEFQEHREYRPGDDLRHLDWAAYGRSDMLMLRLFREEVSPKLQILLDGSRSMAAGTTTKSAVARQLAATFTLLGADLGGRAQVTMIDGRRPAKLYGPAQLNHLFETTFDGIRSLADLAADNGLPAAHSSIRLVISDFLFPHDPARLITGLARDVTALWIIQILALSEADPSVFGGRKLIDAESGDSAQLMLDRPAIIAYKHRLAELQEGLARECRRMRARFVTVTADHGLESICREELCPAGLLYPV